MGLGTQEIGDRRREETRTEARFLPHSEFRLPRLEYPLHRLEVNPFHSPVRVARPTSAAALANRYRIEKIGIESIDVADVGTGQSRRIPLKGN